MLYFVAVWIALLIACAGVGIALLSVFKADRLGLADRWILAVWLGIVILALAWQTIALALPLSPTVGALVAVGLVTVALSLPQTRLELTTLGSKLRWPAILGSVFLSVAIAAFMARKVVWIDTGLYHYGAIQWLSQHGVVPGLVLLNRQFGFVSAWFAFAAPFNPARLDGQASAIANGFVLFVAVLHFLISVSRGLRNRATLSDWFVMTFSAVVLPILLFTQLLSVILVSASPDIPVILFTGVVGWALLLASERARSQTPNPSASNFNLDLMPLILAAGAVSFKLTGLPLLAIASLFYVFARGFRLSRLGISIGVVAVLLAPIVSAGILASGCPLYPSSALCLDVPWARTSQEVYEMAERTRGWGDWFGAPPTNMPNWLWLFWQWFKATNSSKLITAALIFSVLALAYVVRVWWRDRHQGLLWLSALAILGSTFMMLQAPLLRFGLGYVVLLPTLALAVWLSQTQPKFFVAIAPSSLWARQTSGKFITLGGLFLGALAVAIALNVVRQPLGSRLILPPSMSTGEVVRQQANDVVYFAPDDGICWVAPLPCAAEPDDQIQLRRPEQGIRAGFRN